MEHGSVPTMTEAASHGLGGPCSRGQGQKHHIASTLGPLPQDGRHRAACPVPLLCLKGGMKAPELHHTHRAGSGQSGKLAVAPSPKEKPTGCLEQLQQLWP